MALADEIEQARRQVKTDFYAMSIGEVATMYENDEIIINPSFQRLFRWGTNQKSKFIESILLGIPIPPIFVFETGDGQWELIDGLQRISTIFEFMGILRFDGETVPPSFLSSTVYLPSLVNTVWTPTNLIRDLPRNRQAQLGKSFQFEFRRSRINIQILKRPSDEASKYDLFQRLNSGGTITEPQEIRNCAVIMANEEFFDYCKHLSDDVNFKVISRITEAGKKIQKHMEFVMRFLVFLEFDFNNKYDVETYIDEKIREISLEELDYIILGDKFKDTFRLLRGAFGADALRRYDTDSGSFVGQVGLVALEGVAVGIARNIEAIAGLDKPINFVKSKIRDFWTKPEVRRYGASGVSGTKRLTESIVFGAQHFAP